MNKSKRKTKSVKKTIFTIFAVVIAVTLCATFCACSSVAAINKLYNGEILQANLSAEFGTVSKLSVDAEFGDVVVKRYDGNTIRVSYYAEENVVSVQANIAGDTLGIVQKTLMRTGRVNGGEICIEVPSNHTFSYIDLELNAGSVDVSGIASSVELDVEIDAGNAEVKNCSGGKLDVSVDAGNVRVQNCTFNTEADVSTDLGNVSVDALSANLIKLDLDVGNIVALSLSASRVQAEVDTGDIALTVDGEKNEYSLSGGATVGNCNFTPQTAAGNKSVYAKVSIGNVSVNFLTQIM